METIKDFLSSKGINESDIILDGELQEIKTPNFKGWYRGNDLGAGKRRITIEDWRTKDRRTISEGFDPKDPEIRAQLEIQQKEFQLEKEAHWEHKKKIAQQSWQKYKLSPHKKGSVKYLLDKGIENLFGALVVPAAVSGFDLIIPIHSATGELWNYQRIQGDGRLKSFIPLAKVDGLWFELEGDEKVNGGQIFIAEGFATAASVKMAVSGRVLCAFYAGNMLNVAKEQRALNPHAEIIICADDDWQVEGNPGLQMANEAAGKVSGRVCVPKFLEPRENKYTDFNDLLKSEGLDIVRKQLEVKLEPVLIPQIHSYSPISSYINGLKPLNMKYNKQGKAILPPEFEAAAALDKYYNEIICKWDDSLFIYKNNHWEEMDEFAIGQILLQIHALYAGEAPQTKVESVFRAFRKSLVPKAPRNLFILNPYLVNFKNGTLHIYREGDKWAMKFLEHRKEDYCTTLIPIDYDETRKIRNPEFEAMLSRILVSSTDPEDKLKAIRQMYGACLAPIFPHLFMLHGHGGSGKTSLILGAKNLIHVSNISSVDPHEFQGFLMESMAGKLVNIVTDIDLTEPIRDAHIKKIEDRIPIRIDRKFKNAVMAPLPAVHVFGGNDIPATYEKGSGAHERRWTFLEISGFKATGNYSKSFANEAFSLCPQGVLNFALDGLQEVLDNNGHYFTPESGKLKMKRWQMEHDPVALFIDEIVQGEMPEIRVNPEGRIPRTSMWAIFILWYRDAYSRGPRISKNKFYDALLKCTFPGAFAEIKIIEGVRHFSGFSVTGIMRGVDGAISRN